MAMHIVMVEPEIPPNTGNVARSCAITDSVLHLVRPLGFSIDDRSLRRAGLDYWPYVKVQVHDSLDEFLEEYEGRRMFFSSTRGNRLYTDINYRDEDMLVFGRETAGLPGWLLEENRAETVRIPMSRDTRSRSLNLSNSVSIVLFEAMRQQGFPGLK